MKFDSLRDVFVDLVRDLYSAETQLVRALPKMAKAAAHPDLKAGFTAHLEETKGQVARLDEVCAALGVKAKGKTCVAMKGLIEEGAEVMAASGDEAALDAALIAAAQKVEHYEIAGYGTAVTFARLLGEEDAAGLLEQTLAEEKAADEKLTAVAEAGINAEAADGDEEGEDEPPPPARKPKAAKPKPKAAKPARR